MTTARLISGLCSTIPSKFYLYGDASANRRDFMRVIEPLERVGAKFFPRKKTLPLTIEGTSLPLAQKHVESRGSGQVKSMLLLSALSTPGITTVEELKEKSSRTHTEIFLKKIGCDIKFKKTKKSNLIYLRGQKNLYSFNYSVKNDPSSAAYLICLSLLTPGSKLTLPEIICNDTRIEFIKILKKMNGRIKIKDLKRDSSSGELVGTIIAYGSKLKPITVSENVAKFIDDLPILFICAALQNGVSKFYHCHELIHKETNRLLEIKKILIQIGVKCKITKNSIMTIYGKGKIETRNKSILINTPGDHRINLAAAILSLATGIKTKIKRFDATFTSFPGFTPIITSLGGKIVTN
jgi:3-phosphoshikimate 1-carboxyvinyltransferase